MAYLDWAVPQIEHDHRHRQPIEMFSYLELHIPGFPLQLLLSDVLARTGRTDSFTIEPAIQAWNTTVYESPIVSGRDIIPNMAVTISNFRLDKTYYSLLLPLYDASGVHIGTRWWPHLSDLITAAVHPNGIQAIAYITSSEGTIRRVVFRGIVDSILSYSPERITLQLVRDRRWDDTIPRHRTEDQSTGLGPNTGVPLACHYGRWGDRTLAGQTSGFAFRPYGRNADDYRPEIDKGGGFRCPCPIEPLDESPIDDGRSRKYAIARYFSGGFFQQNISGTTAISSVYIASGDGLARLHNDTTAGVTAVAATDSDLWPRGQVSLTLDASNLADFRLYPDRLDNSAWSTGHSFGRMTDGLAETWISENVLAAKSTDFYFNGGSNRGLVTALEIHVDLWAEGVPSGDSFTGQVAATLTYGDGLTITDSQNFTNTSAAYSEGFSVEFDATFAIDPSANGIQQWDFTYSEGSSGDRLPVTLNIQLDRISGDAQAINMHIRGIYLLVTYQPFLRAIDDWQLVHERAEPMGNTELGVQADGWTIKLKQKVEAVRGYRPRVFIDSDGVRDFAHLVYGVPEGAPFGHFYGKIQSGPGSGNQIIENPARICAHIIDSFGVGRQDSNGTILTRAVPRARWNAPVGQRLGEFPLAADASDAYIASLTGNQDDEWRVRWLIDRETSILENAYRLANENQLVIEQYDGIDTQQPGTPGSIERETIGAWVPNPTDSAGNPLLGTPPPLPEFWWRDGTDVLDPGDIYDLEVTTTPTTRLVNSVIINFAYDYVRNNYMRTLKVDHEGASSPIQPGDLPDNWAADDAAHCLESLNFYGQEYKRILNLRSVYRWSEAAAIRSILVRSWYRQRLMLKLTTSVGVAGLATPGKVFQFGGFAAGDSPIGTKYRMLFPAAIRQLQNYTGDYNTGRWSTTLDTYWWRVVRYQFHLAYPPRLTVWAIEGI